MDLRKRIAEAYDEKEGIRQEVADRFKVSIYMVKKLLSQCRKQGSLEPQDHRCGRKAKQVVDWKNTTGELTFYVSLTKGGLQYGCLAI